MAAIRLLIEPSNAGGNLDLIGHTVRYRVDKGIGVGPDGHRLLVATLPFVPTSERVPVAATAGVLGVVLVM